MLYTYGGDALEAICLKNMLYRLRIRCAQPFLANNGSNSIGCTSRKNSEVPLFAAKITLSAGTS